MAMSRLRGVLAVLALGTIAAVATAAATGPADTVVIRELVLPPSPFLSAEARTALGQPRSAARSPGPALDAEAATHYPVRVEAAEVAGVAAMRVSPRDTARANRVRGIIIYMRGGGARRDRYFGVPDIAPIVAATGYSAFALDYAGPPEAFYPTAPDAGVRVYRELLKSRRANEIAIVGSSFGGGLSGQLVARIVDRRLPAPAALAILCAGLAGPGGDSLALSAAIAGRAAPGATGPDSLDYYRTARPDDPLFRPVRSPGLLSRFPPTLFSASTRGVELSQAAYSHATLRESGVDAELHVWDGLPHCFQNNPRLPESAQLHRRLADFLRRHIGQGLTPRH